MKQASVLILGCGRIGSTIARLLSYIRTTPRYDVTIADASRVAIDCALAGVNGSSSMYHPVAISLIGDSVGAFVDATLITNHFDYVINCLPHDCMIAVAQACFNHSVGYLDITEDREATSMISTWNPTFFVAQQLGLAPGFINILGYHMLKQVEKPTRLRMRTGSLPSYPSNPPLNYSRLWSIEGLINEYSRSCQIIQNGKVTEASALDGLESVLIHGQTYEGFYTSGGVASMCDELVEQGLQEVSYRSLRYPGHHQAFTFLRDTFFMTESELVALFNRLPTTTQDVVVISCDVQGSHEIKNKTMVIYPNEGMTAIQRSTACCVCAVLEMHLTGKLKDGLLHHRDIDYDLFTKNRYGQLYRDWSARN